MVSKINILAIIISVVVTFSNGNLKEGARKNDGLGRILILKPGDNSTAIEARENPLLDAKIIRDALEENESNDKVELTLHNVNGKALELIVKWAEYHYDPKHTEKEKDELDEEYSKKDQATLIDLLASANYMNFRQLKDLMCKAIANLIRGKTTEQIRETFHIFNDFHEIEQDDEMEMDTMPQSNATTKAAESKTSKKNEASTSKAAVFHKSKRNEASSSKKNGDSPSKLAKASKVKKLEGSTSKSPEGSTSKAHESSTLKARERSKSKKYEPSTSKPSKDSKSKRHEGSTSKVPESSRKKSSKNL